MITKSKSWMNSLKLPVQTHWLHLSNNHRHFRTNKWCRSRNMCTDVSIHLGKAKRFTLTCCSWVRWRAHLTVSAGKSPARSGPDRSSCPAGGDAEPCGRSYTVSSRWPFLKRHTSQRRNTSHTHYWWITKEITSSSQRHKTHDVGGVRVSDVVERSRWCEPTRHARNNSYTTQNLSAIRDATARAGEKKLFVTQTRKFRIKK